MTTPGSHRRRAASAPLASSGHRTFIAPKARVAAVVVMFAVAIVACVKLSTPSSSAPPTVSMAVAPSSAAPAPSSAPLDPSPSPSVAATPPRYVFPVQIASATYAHTHDAYPASDILAPCGTPVVAAADGVVLEVNRVDRWDKKTDDGAWRGGKFLSILGDDGVRYYGAHFSVINADLAPGTHVTAGQSVGQIGTTGLSSACHLHFGISPPCGRTGDWWNRRGVIWPWRYLDAWRSGTPEGTATSAVPEITAWQKTNGCPTSAPPGA